MKLTDAIFHMSLLENKNGRCVSLNYRDNPSAFLICHGLVYSLFRLGGIHVKRRIISLFVNSPSKSEIGLVVSKI